MSPRCGGAGVERRAALLLMAIALGVYGVYHAIYVITMFPDPASLQLMLLFTVQAVLAFACSIGIWRKRRWAAAAVLWLGASIAVTVLIEAFVLGVIAWLRALVTAVAAMLIAVILGGYLRSGHSLDL